MSHNLHQPRIHLINNSKQCEFLSVGCSWNARYHGKCREFSRVLRMLWQHSRERRIDSCTICRICRQQNAGTNPQLVGHESRTCL